MKAKRMATCPCCDVEIDYLALDCNKDYTFKVTDDEGDWNSYVSVKKEFYNMRFSCPICKTQICRDDPEKMVKFLMGGKVNFMMSSFAEVT